MPRYKFAWSNLPESLLRGLSTSLDLAGDPVEELRRRYGARPRTAFIQENWPILLRAWLPFDSVRRQTIVAQLWSAGLGERSRSINTDQEQLDYLETCRNASTLRDIVLASLLAAGEPTPIQALAPRPVKEDSDGSPRNATDHRGNGSNGHESKPNGADAPDTLNEWIEQALKDGYGFDEVHRDEDGDIPLPRGSSVLFIRPHDGKSPFLEIFAPLLRGFDITPDVYEAANSINMQVPLAKLMVFSETQQFYLAAHLLADTLSSRELLFTLDLVSDAADHFDTLLQKRFGGEIMGKDDEATFDV